MKILAILHGFGLKEGNVTGPFSEVLEKIAELGNEVHVVAPGPKTETFRQKIGHGVIFLHQIEKSNSLYKKLILFPRMALEGIKIKKQYGIDVVHSHIHGLSAFVAMFISRMTGTPHAHWHCEDLYRYYREALLDSGVIHAIRSYLTLVLGMKSANLIITCTDATLECDEKLFGISRNKFRKIPNSVSLERFRPDAPTLDLIRRYNLKGKRVILYVHRLAIRKGPHYLMGALPKIRKKIDNTMCIFVGEGPEEENLKKLAKELEVDDMTIFAGSVPTGSLPPYFAACDVYVMPSEIEGFGRTLAEAMASKKPIVATRVGGVPEVALEDEIALLVPPKDPDALAEATINILTDKKLADKLASNGLKRAKKLYSHERIAKMFLEVFNELIKK